MIASNNYKGTIDNPNFDGTVSDWDRYTPTNSELEGLGNSYDGLNWPGTNGVNYRGAIPLNIVSPSSSAPHGRLRVY